MVQMHTYRFCNTAKYTTKSYDYISERTITWHKCTHTDFVILQSTLQKVNNTLCWFSSPVYKRPM